MGLYACAVFKVMPEHHRLGQHPDISACHWELPMSSETETLKNRGLEGGSPENGLKDKLDIGKANERGKNKIFVNSKA